MAIVTRFAPSPTGSLHLGGARTALFNFLHAKVNNGKFKLRIEDTDQSRNSVEFTNLIIESLKWLGLSIDDEIVYQSKNRSHHIKIAHSLLSSGLAYKCFHEKDYLKQFKSGKKKFVSEWRDKSNNFPNRKFSVRIKSPLNGNYILEDTIQGKVKVDFNEIDDYIILRSDGSPTFLLSSAIDDFDMKVTDIIRGDDHLTNSFRQKIIFDFLNYKPKFSHMSLIHNQQNQKLSKRDKATSILEYKQKGYLPEALINYLIRLGWSHGDEEIFTIKDMKKKFQIYNLGKSPAKFDENKLNFLNNFYIKKAENLDILNNYEKISNKKYQNIFFKQKEILELISLYKIYLDILQILYCYYEHPHECRLVKLFSFIFFL